MLDYIFGKYGVQAEQRYFSDLGRDVLEIRVTDNIIDTTQAFWFSLDGRLQQCQYSNSLIVREPSRDDFAHAYWRLDEADFFGSAHNTNTSTYRTVGSRIRKVRAELGIPDERPSRPLSPVYPSRIPTPLSKERPADRIEEARKLLVL